MKKNISALKGLWCESIKWVKWWVKAAGCIFFFIPTRLQQIESKAATHLHPQPSLVISRLATMGSGGLEGEKMAMCLWQIPVQRNEAHRHSGSCDSFLRPDGTQCIQETSSWHLEHPIAGAEICTHWWPTAAMVQATTCGPSCWKEENLDHGPVDERCCYLTVHPEQHVTASNFHAVRFAHCLPPVG